METDPLDQPAHAGLIETLHERGVISTEARAKSLEWLRERIAWRAWAGNLLLAFGVALVLAGIICFVAANWGLVGAFAKFAALELLLFGCAVGAWYAGLDRPGGQVLLGAAAALVGAVLLLIGIEYPSNAEAYQLLTLWALLAAGWIFVSRCSPLWLLWLVLLNADLIAFWCVRPNEFLWWRLTDPDSFGALSIGLALLNGLPLAVRELAARQECRGIGRGVAWLSGKESRLVPLLGVLGALFVPTVASIVFFDYATALLIVAGALNLVCLAAALYLYRRVLYDLAALVLSVLSLCLLVCIAIGRAIVEFLDKFHLQREQEAFLFLALAVIILLVFGSAVLWLKRVHKAMSEVTHADEE